MTNRICKMCSKEFQIHNWEAENGKGIFCSKSCHKKKQQLAYHELHKKCVVCDCLLKDTTAYRLARRKYCSQKCTKEGIKNAHKVEKNCRCGKQICGRTSYEIKNREWCSVECFQKNFKHSKETIKLLSLKQSERRGKHHTRKTKEATRLRMLGNKFRLGIKISPEHRERVRQAHLGSKSHFYKDGRCKDPAYIIWQKKQNAFLKKSAGGTFSIEEWERMKAKTGYACVMCKKVEPEIKLSVDHIIPLSKGGTNYLSNIQPLCLPCNMRKHNKLPEELK